MLRPHVPRHRPKRHLFPALLTLHLSLLPLPVGRELSHNTSPVRHLRLGPRRLVWVADHDDYLTDIDPQAHPIEQADQGAKCTLELSQVQRCNHAIVRVEEGISTLLSTLAPLFYTLHHHRHSVMHHQIHHHIEMVGDSGSPCVTPQAPLKTAL